ncbi:F-box/kelch-repeat protein SKIP25-like [Cynara cardunculus var. scolymus]|uniref:F-box domain, cyclin-like protein n=1 Tax=Cynara cardunculus var. scolymus TaxID=59895 RepID=A0A103YNH8_CYNCS|nr:F-box/kelch-repeat protein SKIP25-like [Cynara cardunculus var. scolymus]KVI12365.1 F-box domain, cyclin-like protein [Cynara cardunculus var. scolymus]
MAPSFDDHTTSSSRAAAALTAPPYHPLLPGLPDHVAPLCLSLLPPSTLFSVCRSWRRLIYSDSFPAFLSLYTLSSDHNSTLQLSSFDPISSQWTVVAPPLSTTHLCRFCLRHPSFISRNLSIQSVSVSGHLILLAGTSSDLLPALSHPLVFNPLSKTWSFGPPLSTPRRWCATGSSRTAVVVASGFGSHYTQTVARSVEKWVFRETDFSDRKREDSKWVWKNMRSLRDGRFSREAIDAVGCKGKLYMVTCAKEGVVYDVNSDGWSEMAEGMLGGWRGPAAAMDEEMIYMVDESKGVLRKYDDLMEMWVDVLENDMLKGAEHIAAGGGRVCVVRGGGGGILVVDVVSSPRRLWLLDTLAGHQVLALHILPRMCSPEFQSPVVI